MNTELKQPEMVEIRRVRYENPAVKTFVLKKRADAAPGQFGMLWLPGVGEKPLSFSRVDGHLEVTVRDVGPFTRSMHGLAKGDYIGFRGPYGRGFTADGDQVGVIAGGVGAAPLLPLARLLKDKHVTIIVGAKTESELVFRSAFEELAEVLYTTDDGSCGKKCYASDLLGELIAVKGFDQLYCCGPEPMMKKVADVAIKEKIRCQLSLERYMKCGVGVCGQCMLGRHRVCRDGPVFEARELMGTEFGVYGRDVAGARIDVPGAGDD